MRDDDDNHQLEMVDDEMVVDDDDGNNMSEKNVLPSTTITVSSSKSNTKRAVEYKPTQRVLISFYYLINLISNEIAFQGDSKGVMHFKNILEV